jgi:parallel beta-helix repeat protein
MDNNVHLNIFADGIDVYHSDNNIIINNNVSSNRNGIFLMSSHYNTITGNNVSSNDWYGIRLGSGDYCKIIENIVYFNSGSGIFLSASSNDNMISVNHVLINDVGINLTTASNNMIHHNKIDNNIEQAYDASNNNMWNDNYPSGGNYWSDYGGVDNYKGPDQDITGSDGKGDTPYTSIRGGVGAQDNYPLMYPYKPLENYTILKQGWNLISIPLIQEEQNLTRALGSIDSWYDAVQWYDISDPINPWIHHKIGKPFGNDLTHLNETMSFWIYITNPGDTIFLYNGTVPSSNQIIPLHPGWNMVGYPSLSNYNRTAALNNLTFGNHVDAIWTFNTTTQKWDEIGADDFFEVGRGYWIHATRKCVWEVPI